MSRRGRESLSYGGYGSQDFQQIPVTLQTEVLDAFTPEDDSPYESYDEFVIFRADRIRSAGRKVSVTKLSGPSGFGKTTLMGQDLPALLSELTGDTIPDLKKNVLRTRDGEPLVAYSMSWVDVVTQARALGIVPNREFGEWTEEDTPKITQVAERAIEIARAGLPNDPSLPGIDGKHVGVIVVDAISGTATQNNKPRTNEKPVLGHDRFFSSMQKMAADPDLGQRVFDVYPYTDAASYLQRLRARDRLDQVTKTKELKRWFANQGINVSGGRLKALTAYLPTAHASVRAATHMAKQTSELMLRLYEDHEIRLEEVEAAVMRAEVERISEGQLLTDKRVAQLQGRKLKLMNRELFPHIQQSIGLPKEQMYIGTNANVPEHTIYSAVSLERNLITRIVNQNPRYLIPSDQPPAVYL